MIYQNGTLIHNLVRVCDELTSSSRFSKSDVQTLLKCCNVRPPKQYEACTLAPSVLHPDIDDDELDEFCADLNHYCVTSES